MGRGQDGFRRGGGRSRRRRGNDRSFEQVSYEPSFDEFFGYGSYGNYNSNYNSSNYDNMYSNDGTRGSFQPNGTASYDASHQYFEHTNNYKYPKRVPNREHHEQDLSYKMRKTTPDPFSKYVSEEASVNNPEYEDPYAFKEPQEQLRPLLEISDASTSFNKNDKTLTDYRVGSSSIETISFRPVHSSSKSLISESSSLSTPGHAPSKVFKIEPLKETKKVPPEEEKPSIKIIKLDSLVSSSTTQEISSKRDMTHLQAQGTPLDAFSFKSSDKKLLFLPKGPSVKNNFQKRKISNVQQKSTLRQTSSSCDIISFRSNSISVKPEPKVGVNIETRDSHIVPVETNKPKQIEQAMSVLSAPSSLAASSILTDPEKLSREELIEELNQLRNATPAEKSENIEATVEQQLPPLKKPQEVTGQQNGENCLMYQVELPKTIVQFLYSKPKKDPIYGHKRNTSISSKIAYCCSPEFSKAKKTLNIFKFDYTMVCSMLPNRSLYTASSLNQFISEPSERKGSLFNWFTDVLPRVDAHNYITGGLSSSKLLAEEIGRNRVSDNEKWNTDFKALNYKWSKLMLLYLANAKRGHNLSNMLYIDRHVLDKKKLLNDLALLKLHGLRFHYLVNSSFAKMQPNYMMTILLDEIYNKRFSWCEDIETINFFDSTINSSLRYRDLNPRSSPIKFNFVKTPRNYSYILDPKDELAVVFNEFNRIRRYHESISLIRSGAFFHLAFSHAIKLQRYLEKEDNFPKLDLEDYYFDIQHIIISYNNVPHRVLAEIDQNLTYKGSILSYGKIDKAVYAAKFLLSTELEQWEYGGPIMIVARHEKINHRTILGLLDKIDWKISDADFELDFKFFEEKKVKLM